MTGTEFLLVWSVFPLSVALSCGVLFYVTRPTAR